MTTRFSRGARTSGGLRFLRTAAGVGQRRSTETARRRWRSRPPASPRSVDTTVLFGAIPERRRTAVEADTLDGYFAVARGIQDIAPLAMTKWFDTNYHYAVPELGPDTVFTADSAAVPTASGATPDLGVCKA